MTEGKKSGRAGRPSLPFGYVAAWVLVLLLGAPGARGADAEFVRETEAWRKERVAKLIEPDGWLTPVGLHFLKAGESTIGRAKGNDVVIAAGPDRLGTLSVANGNVSLTLADGVDALIGGKRVRKAELKASDGAVKATVVTFGTASFFVMKPSGRVAIRVKDNASAARRNFSGFDYFPIDKKWRVEARWEAFERSRMMPFTDVQGLTGPMLIPGKAVFEWEGKRYELLPIDEGRDRPLFFVISDATSGKETYGACRFIYTEWPKDGKVILDFNRAENPPCAFTSFAMCPLPPKQKRFPFAVTAGEKTYRGKRE